VRCGLESLLVVFPRIRVFNGRFIGLAYRFFEASDCFTERFAQFGELAWTENHQGNYKNNDQLRHAKTSEHTTPPDEEAYNAMLRGKGCQSNGGRGKLGRAARMRISSDHLAACINNTCSRSATGTSCTRVCHWFAYEGCFSRTALPSRWWAGSIGSTLGKRWLQKAYGRVCSKPKREAVIRQG
jgi:hypothetical protein